MVLVHYLIHYRLNTGPMSLLSPPSVVVVVGTKPIRWLMLHPLADRPPCPLPAVVGDVMMPSFVLVRVRVQRKTYMSTFLDSVDPRQ